MRKPAIPHPPMGDRFSQAVKENLEILTGRRSAPIVGLPATATTAEIIAKINEIIRVLQ